MPYMLKTMVGGDSIEDDNIMHQESIESQPSARGASAKAKDRNEKLNFFK